MNSINSRKTNFFGMPAARGLGGIVMLVAGGLALSLIQQAHAQEVDSRIEKIVRADSNDSFNTIAVEEFGSVGIARLLAEYNQLSPTASLAVGTEIIIPTHLEPKKNFATVAFAKGKATRHVAGSHNTTRALSVDDRIYSTDVIITQESGFVSLVLSNGSTLNIQPSTTVSLKTLQCLPANQACDVELDSTAGSVSADVKKRPNQQNRFLISTPYASAAVRGTAFDFSSNDAEMLVGVTHGEVAISAASSVASLPVGFGSRTERGGRPGGLVALLKAPSVNTAPQRFTSEDIVAWSAVAGASSYQISLAADASGQQEFYRQSVSGLTHAVRPLPAGEAHVIIRPLDEQSLKGFRGTQTLNVVNLDNQLPKPSLSFKNDDASVFVFPQGNTADLQHEVQFSETPDFAQLVSVDIPVNGGAKHRLDSETVYYARARVITEEAAVGSYGETLEIPASN